MLCSGQSGATNGLRGATIHQREDGSFHFKNPQDFRSFSFLLLLSLAEVFPFFCFEREIHWKILLSVVDSLLFKYFHYLGSSFDPAVLSDGLSLLQLLSVLEVFFCSSCPQLWTFSSAPAVLSKHSLLLQLFSVVEILFSSFCSSGNTLFQLFPAADILLSSWCHQLITALTN